MSIQPTQPTAGAMRALHTPTPWRAHRTQIIASIGDNEELTVAGCRNDRQGEINAAFIVRAVNTYEHAQADVAALAPFLKDDVRLKWMGDKDGRIYLSVTKEEYEQARAVLARHAKEVTL